MSQRANQLVLHWKRLQRCCLVSTHSVTWRLIVPAGSPANQHEQGDYIEIGHGQPSERHPTYVTDFVRHGGVPADGWYEIQIKAAAASRLDHGYEHTEFDRYINEPLKLALWIAPKHAY